MITEDYVSFEIAKLLKEKGFDVNVINSWHIVPLETCDVVDLEKVLCGDINEPEYTEDYYPMITLQMAMKWLREVHNIFIDIAFRFSRNADNDINFSYYVEKYENYYGYGDGEFNSYEEACEAAIKYCLENLI
jgi:hypothetical protein